MFNLKAVRTYIEKNDDESSDTHFVARLPFSDFGIRASKAEHEIHLFEYKLGIPSVMGFAKVFEERIFFYNNIGLKQKNELIGSVMTAEEYGEAIIDTGILARELGKKNNEQQTRRMKI